MEPAIRAEITELLPRILRFARSLTRDATAAEDLVQTAYIKAVERIDQYERGTRLDSWMFRIVQTSWIDEKRREQRRGVVISFEDAREITMPSHGHDGTDRMFLQKALGSLPEEQRAALALVLLEGYTYREAGGILDIPHGTVMSRVARARAYLARLHHEEDTENTDEDFQRGPS